jgi:hypothetical protein
VTVRVDASGAVVADVVDELPDEVVDELPEEPHEARSIALTINKLKTNQATLFFIFDLRLYLF